jgi:hypothetical protein
MKPLGQEGGDGEVDEVAVDDMVAMEDAVCDEVHVDMDVIDDDAVDEGE